MNRLYKFVNFVSGSEFLSTSPTQHLCERRKASEDGTMSGDEAKRFYESVVSLSSTNSSSCETAKASSSYQNSSDGNTESKRKKRSNHSSLPESSSSASCSDEHSSAKHRAQKWRRKGNSITQDRLVNEFLRNSQNGNLKQLKKLIHESELDINATDKFSWSGLMCAAQEGHIHVVKFLLKQGALWKGVCDANGRNALDLAKVSGHEDIVALLEKQTEQEAGSEDCLQDCSNNEDERKPAKFWCTVCQQEFIDNQRKHKYSTVHLFNCQHQPKRTFYYIPEGNVGYQMMLKSGWKEDKGLGPEGVGRKFPVKTVLKRDRSGLRTTTNKEARVTHFGPGDESAVKGRRKANKDKRERKPRKISKKEKLAQEKSERMWEKNLRIYMSSD